MDRLEVSVNPQGLPALDSCFPAPVAFLQGIHHFYYENILTYRELEAFLQ